MEKKNHTLSENACQLPKTCLIWVYIILGLISSSILIIFCCTNIYRNIIFGQLALRNGTSIFDLWQRPPVRIENRVYIFNYTNTKEFESGEVDKLKVEEVGPYVYKETLTRVNTVLHGNGSITYQEKRSYQWESGRSDDETLIVPNVPLLSAVAFSKDMNFVAQFGLTAVLSTLRAETFIPVTAGGFTWGYDDKIFEMAKPLMSFRQRVPDKFGILALKNGISADRITIDSGVDDIKKLGEIQHLNGMDRKNVWGDQKCDEVSGTDGSMFPPHLVEDRNNTLYVYAKDFCRKIPFRYDNEVINEPSGLPALRYKLPIDTFESTPTKDSCFCLQSRLGSTSRVCPPAGILNISRCNIEANMLTSFPHFYGGDESLLQQVHGLKPLQIGHETYIDLHPRFSVPITSWSRFQVNVEVRTSRGLPFTGNLKDGTILPLLWIESGFDIPEQIVSDLRDAHLGAAVLEYSTQWGSFVLLILSICGIYFTLKKHRNEKHAVLQRNVSGQDKLLE